MNLNLSVKDFLDTGYLKPITKVVAGEKGLSRTVRWVHVLEVRDVITDCVDGNEMILTTGIGFTNKEIALNFVMKLINCGVSALCIETALYYHDIAAEIIDLANMYDFPIIEITEISRFVDISKGLNTMLVNNKLAFYESADLYDEQLGNMNGKGTIADGIRYTANYLDLEVAYLPKNEAELDVPDEMREFEYQGTEPWDTLIKDNEIYSKANLAILNLRVLGRSCGHLIFNSKNRELSQLDHVILKRLGNKIKNDIYYSLLKNEATLLKNEQWLKLWLKGALSEHLILENLRNLGIKINQKEFIVCCIRIPDVKLNDDAIPYTTLIIRRTFEKEGLKGFGYMEENLLTCILLIPNQMRTIWESMEKVISELRGMKDETLDFRNAIFSIGKKVENHTELNKSYETAILGFDNKEAHERKVVIYDKLYLKRIFEKLKKDSLFNEFIKEQLGALTEEINKELLLTLKVFYECNCSKQKTAERLFIVRQTLYFRLQKIADLIGEDFLDRDKRIALEFAIQAYYYENV